MVLLLGGSIEREGALDWAASRPNLLNVAVTRDRRRWGVLDLSLAEEEAPAGRP